MKNPKTPRVSRRPSGIAALPKAVRPLASPVVLAASARKRAFRQTTTVNHQGTVIAFARDASALDIYYNVLDLKVSSLPDGAEWTGFNKLPFPEALRPAGLGIVTVGDVAGRVLAAGDQPFLVLSDGQYVCLYQQSARNTLLLTRFMLKRVAGELGTEPVPTLEPVWEVRFQRSGKQDVPGGKIDSQSYLSPEGTPFIEPIIELPMIQHLENGAFSALILPAEAGDRRSWQFFSINAQSKRLDLFSCPMDDSGLFDLSKKPLDSQGMIPPDVSVALTFSDGEPAVPLPYAGAPSSTLYTLNERVQASNGDSLLLKRTARVLVTLLVERAAQQLGVATLDFALAKTGKLAQIARDTVVSIVRPANYALQFSKSAYLSLPNIRSSLALKGSFTAEFWLQVTSAVLSDEFVFRGDPSVDAKAAAPYVKVTQALEVEVGFGNGTTAVTAVTNPGVVTPLQWLRVEVGFDSSKASANFTIKINGNGVALQGADNKTLPSGSPITTISGLADGIVGVLEHLKISDASSGSSVVVGDWEFDSIDYANSPPTTPDRSTFHNDAEVYGAALVPSSAPTADSSQGTLQVDPDGLTIYGGLLSFAEPASSPTLLTGSDGLVHMYFQGPDDRFSVAHLDAETARAVFGAQWTAKTSSNTQVGSLELIAARAGIYMNASSIVIAPAPQPELCLVTLDNHAGRVETWQGVPRELEAFAAVLNGESTNNLNDTQFRAGARTFYDCDGEYATVRLAVDAQPAACLTLLCRYPQVMQLASAQISVAASSSTVAVGFDVPQWGALGSITQTWPNLPLYARDVLTVLDGTQSSYDYSSTTSSDVRVYSLWANGGGGRYVALLFARSDVTALSVEIKAGSANELCAVTIELVASGAPARQTFSDVARDQVQFAELLRTSPLAPFLLMITNDLPAELQNRVKGVPDLANLLAWAKVLFAFPDAPLATAAKMVAAGPVSATIAQRASYVDGGTTHTLDAGSTLFRVSAEDTPNNGGLGLVDDTAIFTHGDANLVTAAVNGGWLMESPHKAIQVSGQNSVAIDPRAVAADVLALAGDVSLELWCHPTVGAGSATNQPRLLSYQRKGSPQLPDELIEYSLGLVPAPAALFGDSTAIYGSYNLSGPDCSMQIWLCPQGANAGQVLQISTTGVVQPYLTLAIDDGGYAVATYANHVGSVTSTAPVKTGAWLQLSVTLAQVSGTNNVALTLYVNGAANATQTIAAASVTRVVGSFAAGATSGAYVMAANGILMWCRALDAEEIAQSYEQTVRPNADSLVIAWYLTDGTGDTLVNRALDGSPFVTQIVNQPDTPWLSRGVYFAPFATNRGYGLVAQDTPVLGGWCFLASTYRSAYALRFAGADYANCGHDSSLEFDSSCSFEAWIQPDRTGVVQTFLSKPGNYELGLNYDNTIVFTIWTSDGTKRLVSKERVTAGAAFYIAATANTATNQASSPTKDPVPQTYVLELALYVNGALSASFSKNDYTEPVNLSTSKINLNLGRNSAGAAYFQGFVSDVRVWNVALAASTIADTYTTHLPGEGNGLVSYWRFAELTGKVAYDQNNLNNAIVTSNELWSLFSAASALTLLVDGSAQPAKVVDPATLGGYGVEQLTLGGLETQSAVLAQPFYGQLNEVRIWNIQLTPEQISESMFRQLSGAETGLVGYWPFDAGSGSIVEDATGHGNVGVLKPESAPPLWVSSTAPVSNEAEQVFNVLGGVETPFVERITGMPSVVEYADTRRDAYGALFSVMKRCYASTYDAAAQLITGYTIGDLDTVYAGQVQTQPSLIGYIEGAPPIPSENQTNPWWTEINYLNTYADTASVKLTQAQKSTQVFTGSEKTGGGSSIEGKVGVYLATSASLSFGLGEEVGWETWHLDGHLGYAGESKSKRDSEQELGFGFGKTTTSSDELSAGGEWEPADNVLNPEVGRRYVPENLGYALVKSLTADMYLIKLRGSNTVVKTTLVPNTDIPPDVNIINFPIDPAYVRNGTLDGRVGFKNDPAYPYADVQPGSYFKPLEAYNLKRSIERQDKQLEAYYQQFSTSNYSQGATITISDGTLSITNGFERFRDQEAAADASYDWQAQLAKRSLCNTYVWTAGGGLHTEQSELVDTYSESYAGVSEYESSNGVVFDLAAAFVAGVYGEFDSLWSTSLEVTSIKRSESESSFGLDVEYEPDRFLKRPVLDNAGTPVGYTEDNAPGKVNGYRFLSFFIAPSQDNFLEFQRVVDQNWLQNSSDPNAAALLTATSAANGAWRVLHRVTYVSRVPPPLQPSPAQTLPEPITPPANLASNTIIVRLVTLQLSTHNPSPAQLGEAVTAVLGVSPTNPGLLAGVLTWWTSFLTTAQDTRSAAYAELTALRTDLLTYMIQTYAAEEQQSSAVKSLRSHQSPKEALT